MKFIKILLAITYCSFFTYLVFFARRRRHIAERLLNLVPIKHTIREFYSLDSAHPTFIYNFYTNLLGNIALFFPIAIIARSIFNIENSKQILLFCAGLSIGIETIQYIFKLGVADIDDVLLNTLGGAAGILCVNLVKNHNTPSTAK